MSLFSRSILCGKLCEINFVRIMSTVAKHQFNHDLSQSSSIRTEDSNPDLHSQYHINKYYRIPQPIQQKLFKHGGLPKTFQEQIDTFLECALLIRYPAVEIMSYLKQADYRKPVNKYVLYGLFGTGKSLSLAHVLHYAFVNKFIIVHVPTPNNWYRFPKEVSSSQETPDCMELPLDAAQWLISFQNQNNELLSELDLTVSKTYEFTSRECTTQGTPFGQLISFGISRVKFATKVIKILMDELKWASTAGKCKTFVAVDGYNAFWSDHTSLRDENRQHLPAQKLTLTTPFLSITKSDWCNGAIVLVVDQRATKERRESHLPRYLLGKEGFEFLDPFVPISVDQYSESEFYSVLAYYEDRKWIRNVDKDGKREIELLSGRNPRKVLEFCNPL